MSIIQIRNADAKSSGPTPNCPGCDRAIDLIPGDTAHTPQCRKRIVDELARVGGNRIDSMLEQS